MRCIIHKRQRGENYLEGDKRTQRPKMKLVFSRPMKNDRVIFGELVPYGKEWRLGANEATMITFYKRGRCRTVLLFNPGNIFCFLLRLQRTTGTTYIFLHNREFGEVRIEIRHWM